MSSKLCSVPWKEVYIGPGGTYGLCCFSDQNHKGVDVTLDTPFVEHWNGEYMKQTRTAFAQGQSLPQCRLCWQEEDAGKISGRMRRNRQYSNHSDLRLDSNPFIIDDDGTSQEKIQGLHFSVGNDCQLRCIDCSPIYSRSIKKDYEKLNWDVNFSTRKNSQSTDQWNNQKTQIYLWPMLREIIKKNGPMKYIRVTGGEPTLSRQLIEFLDWYHSLGYTKETNLFLSTNSVNIKPEFIDRLGLFQQCQLDISVDGVGAVDEYLRFPTNWEKKEKLIDELARLFPSSSIHSTIYSLNVGALPDLIDWAVTKPIGHSLQVLFYPDKLSVKHLPDEYKQELIAKLESYTKIDNQLAISEYDDKIAGIGNILRTVNSQTNQGLNEFTKRLLIQSSVETYRKNNLTSVIQQLQQPGQPEQWEMAKNMIKQYDSIRRHKLGDIVPSLARWVY